MLPDRFLLGDILVEPDLNQIGDKRVQSKTMDVLIALVGHEPHTVSVHTLLNQVWPNVMVVDGVVHKAITRLRKAFGDNPQHPCFVETIRGRGYRIMVSPDSIVSKCIAKRLVCNARCRH